MTATDFRVAFAAMGIELDTAPPPTAQRYCAGAACNAMVDRSAPSGLCNRCLVAEVEARREAVLTSILPEIHVDARFGSAALAGWCKDASAVRWARAFGEKAPRCPTVTLWGTTGSGKSTLAAAMLRALLAGPRRHCSARWYDARDLARARKQYRLGGGDPPELERAVDADILVIDELGKETLDRNSDPADVVMVLDERHRARDRLTIVTTEWAAADDATGAKLKDLYMPSLVRRLTEPWRAGPPPVGAALVIRVRRDDEMGAS
jgi:hypothetical protein